VLLYDDREGNDSYDQYDNDQPREKLRQHRSRIHRDREWTVDVREGLSIEFQKLCCSLNDVAIRRQART